MPSVQQLRYLIAVADHGNFSRAADACNVTQPTLSMQLKDMENRIGVQLVERTRTKVLMTPVGSEIARRARSVIAEVEDIREIARHDKADVPRGPLRLGVVQTVGGYVLSLAVPQLRVAYPDLRIMVREDRLETLPGKLSDGAYDVLLLPEKLDDPDFVSVVLLREPLHLVVQADHRLAAFDTVDPKELAGETILSMERGHRIHEQIARLCAEVGAAHATDYAGTTLDTLRLMVTCGMGISLLPALYVRSDVQRETQVVSRPLSHGAPVRELTMVWRKASPRNKAYQIIALTISDSIAPWGLAA
jgi:LysR family hydrogen peroxide-inducible transcriptional activator